MSGSKNGRNTAIPIIDLFAGPGGLGEGFSRFPLGEKKKSFRIAVSIEKDPCAHKTLTLRAFFRQFREGEAPEAYYQYLRGESSKEELFGKFPKQAKAAFDEAQMRTLGEDSKISKIIGDKIKGHDKWVLIGGPPCQAYSLAGRSRMLGLVPKHKETDEAYALRKAENEKRFESDHRHTLYKEYLKIIADHSPPVFVMENVKGILSAKLDGELIFPKILDDLRDPFAALGVRKKGKGYRIHSLVKNGEGLLGDEFEPRDFLIRAEEYGVPQARHRVILLGIREDIENSPFEVLKKQAGPTVDNVIGDLPELAPGLSRGRKGRAYDALLAIAGHPDWKEFLDDAEFADVSSEMVKQLGRARKRSHQGSSFEAVKDTSADEWYFDSRLGGFPNHETRSHIPEDLWRYFFCACFASVRDKSPTLKEFPEFLLPKHKNVEAAIVGQKFGDRFRVQCANKPSTTVTSHISKDGHYFIHPDPTQPRGLTYPEPFAWFVQPG
jgi:DNA (cytosine-5)-methyltransferase 1